MSELTGNKVSRGEKSRHCPLNMIDRTSDNLRINDFKLNPQINLLT
jgi:hypothetical protein